MSIPSKTRRDYSLTGIYQGRAVALDDDRLEDQVEDTWWHPTIARSQLKVLMQRNDGPALYINPVFRYLYMNMNYQVVV